MQANGFPTILKLDGPSGLPAPIDQNIDFQIFREGSTVEVGKPGHGGRQLEILHSPLRLLATAWVYDSVDQILFTSDAFGHVTVPTQTSSQIVDAATDTTTVDVVRDHLFTKNLSGC